MVTLIFAHTGFNFLHTNRSPQKWKVVSVGTLKLIYASFGFYFVMACHWTLYKEVVKFMFPASLTSWRIHNDPYSSALLCRSALHAYYVRSIQMFLYIARKQAWVIPLFLLSSLLISLCYWHVSSLFHHTWIPYHAITVSQRKRCSASQSKHAEHRKKKISKIIHTCIWICICIYAWAKVRI